jgi:hypothetical protein
MLKVPANQEAHGRPHAEKALAVLDQRQPFVLEVAHDLAQTLVAPERVGRARYVRPLRISGNVSENESHIIRRRSCVDVGGGQTGIVAKIELCGSSLHFGDDESLDGVEADGAEPDHIERRRGDDRLGKDLHQPQRLDELALAAIAHAGFQ